MYFFFTHAPELHSFPFCQFRWLSTPKTFELERQTTVGGNRHRHHQRGYSVIGTK